MQKIIPHLWYDGKTEEAMRSYTSIFESSRIVRSEKIGGGPADGNSIGEFEIAGLHFGALDGGPYFSFSPAVSFFVSCASTEEIDALWSKLSDGGQVLMPLDAYPFSARFGWCADRYGVSWQLNLHKREQKIAPALLFVGDKHGKAEEAIRFYVGLFDDSGIVEITHYGEGEQPGEPEGSLKHAIFTLHGQEFMAMESAFDHQFTFTPAISFLVNCNTQEEIDALWERFADGGEIQQCGWVIDRFGVAWQVTPTRLGELFRDPDRAKAKRALEAMLQMKKLDIAGLEQAAEGE